MKPELALMAALLASTVLPGSAIAQNVITRSAILSGGGRVVGSSVTLSAGLGESVSSVPGSGTHVIRSGFWLIPNPTPTAVDGTSPILTGPTSLDQNFPNPFNPRTVIPFALARDGERVRLTIYNLSGRRVRTLLDKLMPAGPQRIVWDGKDAHDRAVASGVYIYRLETTDFQSHRKLVLVR